MGWDFINYKKSLMCDYFGLYPYLASFMGLEEYYHIPGELSSGMIKETGLFIDKYRKELDKHRYSIRTSRELYEADLIDWNLGKINHGVFSEREYETDPFSYFNHLDYSVFLKLTGKEPDYIAKCIVKRIEGYPGVLYFMENTLNKASYPALDVFHDSIAGLKHSLETDLKRLSAECRQKTVKEELDQAADKAMSVTERMLGLVKDLQINNTTPYSIGTKRLEELIYYYELEKEDLSSLLKKGEREVESLKARAREIMPGSSLQDAYENFLGSFPGEQEVLPMIEKILGDISDFIRERDIIDLYDLDTLKVEKMPPYFEWASAMMSTPGPFVKQRQDSHFYVTLPKKDWSQSQKEEFLRNFNPYLLENLSIHEALPGHFLHGMHANRIDNDIIKISYGYGFSEGWAHYCEEMMLEEGFRKGDPGGEMAKIREQMLRLVRLISSIRMHTGTMSLEESRDMFSSLCFLDEESARKEAFRGTHDPGYLLYTYGKWKVKELREKTGGKSNLKEFHKKLLSLGCPPLGLMEKYFGQIIYF